jgi:succinate-acetate transporter protein
MADDIKMPTLKANPAALGLLGFGMTTVLLSLHNAGVMPLDAVILSMAVFCGGVAQFAAGMMEYKNGNTFGTTAFTLYGVFWLVFALIKTDPMNFGSEGLTMGVFCLVWGVLTLFLLIGTLRGRTGLKLVFFTLTIVFFMLAAGDLSGIGSIITMAGCLGILCGSLAMYVAFAEVLSEQFEKDILPF